MASSMSEVSRGAKKRTILPQRSHIRRESVNVENGAAFVPRGHEDGRDSGLSSDNSTPTSGSPVQRQRKASEPIRIANSSQSQHAKTHTGRNACDKTQWKNNRVPAPRSLDALLRNRQYSNTRTPRSIQSPCPDSGDEASLRADRVTYQAMFQDIDSIKTILLTLQRVIQEAETLNPFSNSMKNGIFYNLNEGGTADVSTSPDTEHIVADELADLRRQVVFLQGQLEDKDRVIQILQLQMKKIQGTTGTDGQSCSLVNNRNNVSSSNMCNAATQTEKTRPVSAGPSLLQTLPQDGIMGPLVSWSDSWNRHSSLVAEMNCNGSRRKSIDRSPRTIKSCREETSHRLNRQVNKSSADSPPNRRSVKTEDAKSRKAKGFIESND